MDNAGNIYVSDKAYELTATSSSSASKSSSSSSDDDDDDGSVSTHATNTEAEGILALVVSEEPMRQLVVDGRAMAMTLTLETEDLIRPIDFLGSFETWYMADLSGLLSDTPNTLLLKADPADLEGAGDVFTCRWNINGEVFKDLYSAGVDYVVFQVMDDICAVPTAGFVGGTKYTELKMQGVSTKKFDYTLSMRVNRDVNTITAMTDNDFSEDCDFALKVAVEDMTYELSTSEKSPMYYYDVYLGPEEMMLYPFGEY